MIFVFVWAAFPDDPETLLFCLTAPDAPVFDPARETPFAEPAEEALERASGRTLVATPEDRGLTALDVDTEAEDRLGYPRTTPWVDFAETPEGLLRALLLTVEGLPLTAGRREFSRPA